MLEQQEVSLEEIEKNWFIRNKWLAILTVILILMIASVAALAAVGLILTPWLVIPCLLLFTAVIVGIKAYNERKFNTASQITRENRNLKEELFDKPPSSQLTQPLLSPQPEIGKITEAIYPSPFSDPQASVEPNRTLSPVMLYEVTPDESKPSLNVKVVVWSNVKALGKDFLNTQKFALALLQIKVNFNPDVILLDNCIQFSEGVTSILKTFEFEKGFLVQSSEDEAYINKLWFRYDYHMVGLIRLAGFIGLEGRYARCDNAEPLAIRWAPSAEPADLKRLYEEEPAAYWVTPRGSRPPHAPGDHTIIIVPEGASVLKEQCGLFYKSFKNADKGVKRIEGKELILNINSGEVDEKQQQLQAKV